MSRTWLYADPHFGHSNICKFTREDGSPLRPWDDSGQMTEDLINWYNELVDDGDRVYILGDVAMNRRGLDMSVPRLKGRKVLVKGNHDIDKLSYYSKYFDDIRAYVCKKGFILSHIPIHPGSLARWSINIHGHLHANKVTKTVEIVQEVGRNPKKHLVEEPDPRYRCVSVELTDYRPILLDQVLEEAGLKGA